MREALTVIFLSTLVHYTSGHGFLMDPPSRNCMWRYGFKNPPNYNDNELNCGGWGTQWEKNGGKCGVCGDPWQEKNKKHEYPGKYANGIIAKEYVQGQEIEVAVDLTSNHQGWFEFRVGDIGKSPITQAKLKHLLHLVDGGTRFTLPLGSGDGVYTVKLKLPDNLVCNECVMQWWYHCGNTWGCDNKGCGEGRNPKQETFVNCADIRILPKNGPRPSKPPKPFTKAPTRPNPNDRDCHAIGAHKGNTVMDKWCRQNCRLYCPANLCKCKH